MIRTVGKGCQTGRRGRERECETKPSSRGPGGGAGAVWAVGETNPIRKAGSTGGIRSATFDETNPSSGHAEQTKPACTVDQTNPIPPARFRSRELSPLSSPAGWGRKPRWHSVRGGSEALRAGGVLRNSAHAGPSTLRATTEGRSSLKFGAVK